MVKALLFLSLSAALAMVLLLWDCQPGCQLTSRDLLARWSSSLAGLCAAA